MGLISLFQRRVNIGPVRVPNPREPRESLWFVPPGDTWESAQLIVLIEIREELKLLREYWARIGLMPL